MAQVSKNAVAKAIQGLLELLSCQRISVHMNKCLVKEQKAKIGFVNRKRSLVKYHIILLVSMLFFQKRVFCLSALQMEISV